MLSFILVQCKKQKIPHKKQELFTGALHKFPLHTKLSVYTEYCCLWLWGNFPKFEKNNPDFVRDYPSLGLESTHFY